MRNKIKFYSTVLSIAGSDSIGGAGIQADIKTCCSFGVYAATVISSVTAQNTTGVKDSRAVPLDLFESQIRAVLDDITPDAVKIGLIPSACHIKILTSLLKEYGIDNIVVDPVLSPTAGKDFVSSRKETAEAMLSLLFPIATLITPNMPELSFLAEAADADPEDYAKMPERFHTNAILIKGGHNLGEHSTDILLKKGSESPRLFDGHRIKTHNTHGTGCTLSSAIACGLALGHELTYAVTIAKKYVAEALRDGQSYDLGHGNGPLYFFNNIKL